MANQDNMHEYGFWSLLPPLLAIVLAIRTKQVFISLLFGIWLGWMIISDWNPITGTLATIQGLVNVFQDAGNTRTIMFSALVGALIIFIQKSGGVQGFIHVLNRWMEKMEGRDNKVMVQLLAWFTGMVIFVESSITVLTVGTLYRPAFDNLKISREKLAYIADSTSAPTCILIPFNAWGAFIMGLLLTQGYENPFSMMIRSIGYNFYPILAILMVLFIIISKKDFGPMKKAEKRTSETGAFLWPDSQPMVSEELTAVKAKNKIQPRALNMLIPILTMVLMMPVMLTYTGWAASLAARPDADLFGQITYAIGQGSGSTSVLVSIITALIVSYILYAVQKMFTIKEYVDLTMKGISEMMPLALLMLFAFAISSVCRELETGQYVADITSQWLSPALVPFLLFLVSAFIAFSTGTSWGTFGIMIAIGIPMAQSMGANELMTIAAVLGGGVFGDHCSPISDTTIISSMSAATDHIDHVRTQMPYALIIGAITATIYLIMGLI